MQEGLIRKRGKTIRTSPKRKKAIWKRLKKRKNVMNKVVKERDRGGGERWNSRKREDKGK